MVNITTGKCVWGFPAHFHGIRWEKEGYRCSHSLHEVTPPRHRFPLQSHNFIPQPKDNVEMETWLRQNWNKVQHFHNPSKNHFGYLFCLLLRDFHFVICSKGVLP